MPINMSHVKEYIDHVFVDAARGANKPLDSEYDFCTYRDALFLVMRSKYLTVSARIIYRLQNNLMKNFELTGFSIVNLSNRKTNEHDNYDLYPINIPGSIPPHHTIGRCTLMGKEFCILDMTVDREDPMKYLLSLKDNGFDYCEYPDTKEAYEDLWNRYVRAKKEVENIDVSVVTKHIYNIFK